MINTIREWYSYVKSYNDNMKELQNMYWLLDCLKYRSSTIVEYRKQEILHKSTHLTNNWLAKVQYLIEKDNLHNKTKLTESWLGKAQNLVEKDETLKHLIDEKTRKGKDQCFFGRVHCNLYRRYQMSKTAQIKVNEIESIINETPNESMIMEPRLDLKSISNEFYKALRGSRVELMEEILKKLRDDEVNVVGIFGMEAIGKTTLTKEIAKKEAKETWFGKIVMVEISRTPNVEHIQEEIADQLNLKLNNKHRIEKRAHFLFTNLKRNSNEILTILDNLCEKIDLEKVGILQHNNNTQQFCCKLLVTSTKRNVCELMGVSMPNKFEVCPLDDNEARQLFRERIGANAEDRLRGQEEMEKKILKLCGGLPLAIVALAYVLKNQELSTWERFASELEKSILDNQAKISGVHPQMYSILQMSYRLMENEEKRRFFMLAFLFPFGASIPVEEMMRYGIGLGLFQQFDNLIGAMKQANTWFDELKSSALLVEDGSEDYTKIHDVVWASIMSLAEKDGHGDMVMGEAFPQSSWDYFQKCYAISVIDHSRINDLNSDKLQILILDKSKHEDHFPDNFFEGMSNLKVLVLKGMDFTPELPISMRKLKNSLRTLLLEECKLGDITRIVELTNLVVLSLRWSIMEELPEKLGDLCNLRLLDLNGCVISKKGVSANVLSNLSWLEGLYTLSPSWRFDDGDNTEGGEYAYAHIAELNKFRHLKVLSANLIFEDWPIHNELEFVKNLDQFHICAGRNRLDSQKYPRSRSLQLTHIKNLRSSCVAYDSLRVLLEKSQLLRVKFMWELKHIFNDTHQQEGETKMQSLVLEYPHLQHLMVRLCPKMHSISSTPFEAPNLTELTVSSCDNMKFIFLEHARQGNICIKRYSGLKRMSLEYLPKLESLTGIINRSTTSNKARHQILFNKKMIFPLLEQLVLHNCGRIEKLWEVKCKEMNYYSSFKNLCTLEITRCDKLEVLGLLSIAIALEQLEQLSIDKCSQLREIISQEEEEEIRDLNYGFEIFPSLESVRLKDCLKLKMFISGRNLKDRFPKLLLLSLQKVDINKCPQMKFFSLGPSFMAPKLNQIEFDCVVYPMDETNKDDINTAFVKICSATNLSEDIDEE